MAEDRSYRIRTEIGDGSSVLHVKLDQTYDTLEILSLNIDQANAYKLYQSNYGIVVGRVVANGGVGLPNAKVSIFIESDGTDGNVKGIMYPYQSVRDTGEEGVRYNLLPQYLDKECHQNVGTFPDKRFVLDNQDVIEVFDKYYKYTTTTNNAGDYMIYGVPTGSQQLHVDVDLSDIGVFSQRPRDMIYKGFDINMFDSPNKFKQDKNLNALVQIHSQDVGIYVYPYWGDTTQDTEIAVTRCDIQITYKIEPTCVFMGSVITDTGSNAIGKNCGASEKAGKMSEMVTGEGTIEMIRKTIDNKVEEFQIKGNRLIDGDGVWCYQIPMNLDYVMTDEFGNLVPSDNPDKGIPTRTRVRFRISMDETPNDNNARKRCRYLVPNNPRLDKDRYPEFYETKEVDYEFGTNTADESFRDLLWNKVYTVKNYIPRLQNNSDSRNRNHTGIKLISHFGDNNPMPYNAVDIKLSFSYKLLCILAKLFLFIIQFLNGLLTLIAILPCLLYQLFTAISKPFCFLANLGGGGFFGWILALITAPFKLVCEPFKALGNIFKMITPSCIGLNSDICGDNATHAYTFYPGCGYFLGIDLNKKILGASLTCIRDVTLERHNKKQVNGVEEENQTEANMENHPDELVNCMENALAQDFDATSFNFQNDWINGVLYMPMWFRKITPKKTYLFGLFKKDAKDEWCSAESIRGKKFRKFLPCAVNRTSTTSYFNSQGVRKTAYFMKDGGCKECNKAKESVGYKHGVVLKKQTMLGQDVYYYVAAEVDSDNTSRERTPDKEGNTNYSVSLMFATDIVLLGSLNEFDINGIPQFFKSLESTTYKLPPNVLFTDNILKPTWTRSADGTMVPSYDVVGDDGVTIVQSSTSEMTGSDWGNYNEDLCNTKDKNDENLDSGLFYGFGCFDIHIRPKSCINVSRICEFGVSLDETKRVLKQAISKGDSSENEANYDLIVPDGYISKDELYNDSQRSAFATLNGNYLRTMLNPENGLTEYDFKYLYVDNFDKSLRYVMQETQKKCSKTPRFNYYLEDFCEGYYDFRMGQTPYYYYGSLKHVFPRYENSFYFYFGLKSGKTAIEKFNSQFFSSCTNANEAIDSIGIKKQGNSWCGEVAYLANPDEKSGLDGYVALDLSNVDLPCSILIQGTDNTYEYQIPEDEKVDRISDEKIVLVNNGDTQVPIGYKKHVLKSPILNGGYNLTIFDASDNITTMTFTLNAAFLQSDVVPDNFALPYNVLKAEYCDYCSNSECDCNDNEQVYEWIRTNGEGLPEPENESDITTATTRAIGGTIAITRPVDSKDNTPIQEFRIDIVSSDGRYRYSCTNDSQPSKDDGLFAVTNCFFIGVPKGNEEYQITITELCDDVDSNNIMTQTVKIVDKKPYKLFINENIDYDVISHWLTGYKASTTNGKTGSITTSGKVSDYWWHLSADTKGQYQWGNANAIMEIGNSIIDQLKLIKSLIMGSFFIIEDSGLQYDKSQYDKYVELMSQRPDDDYVKNFNKKGEEVAGKIGIISFPQPGEMKNEPVDIQPETNVFFDTASPQEIEELKKGIKVECDILNSIANGTNFKPCYTDNNGFVSAYPKNIYAEYKVNGATQYINKNNYEDIIDDYGQYARIYLTSNNTYSPVATHNAPLYISNENEEDGYLFGEDITTAVILINGRNNPGTYSPAYGRWDGTNVTTIISEEHYNSYEKAYQNTEQPDEIIPESIQSSLTEAKTDIHDTQVGSQYDTDALINQENRNEIIADVYKKYEKTYVNRNIVGQLEYETGNLSNDYERVIINVNDMSTIITPEEYHNLTDTSDHRGCYVLKNLYTEPNISIQDNIIIAQYSDRQIITEDTYNTLTYYRKSDFEPCYIYVETEVPSGRARYLNQTKYNEIADPSVKSLYEPAYFNFMSVKSDIISETDYNAIEDDCGKDAYIYDDREEEWVSPYSVCDSPITDLTYQQLVDFGKSAYEPAYIHKKYNNIDTIISETQFEHHTSSPYGQEDYDRMYYKGTTVDIKTNVDQLSVFEQAEYNIPYIKDTEDTESPFQYEFISEQEYLMGSQFYDYAYLTIGTNDMFITATEFNNMNDVAKTQFTAAYIKKTEDNISEEDYELIGPLYYDGNNYNVEENGERVYINNNRQSKTMTDMKTENQLPQSTLYVAPSGDFTPRFIEADYLELVYSKVCDSNAIYITETEYNALPEERDDDYSGAIQSEFSAVRYNYQWNSSTQTFECIEDADGEYQAYMDNRRLGERGRYPIYLAVYYPYVNPTNYYQPAYAKLTTTNNFITINPVYTESYYFGFKSDYRTADTNPDIVTEDFVEKIQAILEILETIYNPYENTGLLTEVEKYKQTFITTARQTFQMFCMDEEKTINFSVQTDDRPVTYYNIYKEETYNEEDNSKTVEKGFKYTNQGYQIPGITIPTIVHELSNPKYLDTTLPINSNDIDTHRYDE